MLDRIIMMTPMARMRLRAIFQIFLLLVVVTGILLFVQYRNSGWPFNDEQVVADKSFRVGKSHVENLLVGGNERQLWDKVEQIADDPKLPEAVRMEHLRDRIQLLTKINYNHPGDTKATATLIESLVLREKFAVQYDERTLTLGELEEIATTNLNSEDANLAEQAETGLAVVRLANFVNSSLRSPEDLQLVLDQIDGAKSANVQFAETLSQWSYLLDDKVAPNLSRQYKEWLIANLMLSSRVEIREYGTALAHSLDKDNLELIPRDSFLLSSRVDLAKSYSKLLLNASNGETSELNVARVIEQAEYHLMLGKFDESDENFNKLSQLAESKWSGFKTRIDNVLARHNSIGSVFKVGLLENKD